MDSTLDLCVSSLAQVRPYDVLVDCRIVLRPREGVSRLGVLLHHGVTVSLNLFLEVMGLISRSVHLEVQLVV